MTLPKGGGAIRGIGEKFSTNPLTGTASISVPIFTTSSRWDFYPKLSLTYDSGNGNGVFGLGWDISVPSISRKTEKILPWYRDEENSDTFILSGTEDLVPSLNEKENWKPIIREDGEYIIQEYRPRIEGLFARIERWKNKTNREDVYWRIISKDNITSIYGRNPESRVSDPDDESHIFKWLIEESYDDKGDIIFYECKQENDDNIDNSLLQEKRDDVFIMVLSQSSV
jgi:Salmonella virulence plasmid 65kDa B protein